MDELNKRPCTVFGASAMLMQNIPALVGANRIQLVELLFLAHTQHLALYQSPLFSEPFVINSDGLAHPCIMSLYSADYEFDALTFSAFDMGITEHHQAYLALFSQQWHYARAALDGAMFSQQVLGVLKGIGAVPEVRMSYQGRILSDDELLLLSVRLAEYYPRAA